MVVKARFVKYTEPELGSFTSAGRWAQAWARTGQLHSGFFSNNLCANWKLVVVRAVGILQWPEHTNIPTAKQRVSPANTMREEFDRHWQHKHTNSQAKSLSNKHNERRVQQTLPSVTWQRQIQSDRRETKKWWWRLLKNLKWSGDWRLATGSWPMETKIESKREKIWALIVYFRNLGNWGC